MRSELAAVRAPGQASICEECATREDLRAQLAISMRAMSMEEHEGSVGVEGQDKACRKLVGIGMDLPPLRAERPGLRSIRSCPSPRAWGRGLGE